MKRVISIAVVAACAIGISMAGNPNTVCKKRIQSIFTETYETGTNEGSWTWGNAADRIEQEGGNRGAFLRNDFLVTFAPRARTAQNVESMFTGNLRAKQVVRMSADFRSFSDLIFVEHPLSLVLVNNNDTPDEPFDDKFVYYVGGEDVPYPRKGWENYSFEIPSQDLTAPTPLSPVEGAEGWVIAEGDLFTPAIDPDAVWNEVIEDVDQVIFWWHDPRFFSLLTDFDVGMDNVSVTTCSD